MTIRAAIIGYGNLGRGVAAAIAEQPDMELVGVFSRRASSLDTDARVYPADELAAHANEIDVAFLCLGSATDMPEQAAGYARLVTTVDSYDNHGQIPAHRAAMDEAARAGGHMALISTGWDPGLFSVARVSSEALFSDSVVNTFWGPGISQGHSDALRRIDGVKRAVQYTVPREDAVQAALEGRGDSITGQSAHLRRCVVVAEESDHERITEEIVTMADYFVGYEVTVEFVSEDEFERDHLGMPHGGRVITAGTLGEGDTANRATVEFSLNLESNPFFTAAVLGGCGGAAYRLAQQGRVGAVTVLEVAPYLLSPEPLDELISKRL